MPEAGQVDRLHIPPRISVVKNRAFLSAQQSIESDLTDEPTCQQNSQYRSANKRLAYFCGIGVAILQLLSACGLILIAIGTLPHADPYLVFLPAAYLAVLATLSAIYSVCIEWLNADIRYHHCMLLAGLVFNILTCVAIFFGILLSVILIRLHSPPECVSKVVQDHSISIVGASGCMSIFVVSSVAVSIQTGQRLSYQMTKLELPRRSSRLASPQLASPQLAREARAGSDSHV